MPATPRFEPDRIPPLEPIGRTAWLMICVAGAVLWLAGLGHRPLLSPDEGRYAEIAREMAATGDFVTPRLNGLKYFEKPPLQAWLTAAGFKVFGIDDRWVRAVPALYGLGTCIAMFLTLWRTAGISSGQLVALLAAGTTWIVANSHFVSLDMGLTFWLSVALCGLVRCVDARADPSRSASLWVWIGMAGAFLSKGLIGLVIPAGAMVLTALLLRRPAIVSALRWWPGAAVFGLLVVPWLVAVQVRNPGFFEFFFVHEHLQRFTSEIHRRVEPWWYFVPVLLLGGLPWLGHWFAAARARPLVSAPVDVLLLAWAAFVLIFFSLSGSKLPSYILPAFPALAVWLARRWPALSPGALRASALIPLAAGLVLVGVAVPLTRRADLDESVALAGLYLPWILTAGAAFVVSAALAWRLSAAGRLASAAALALGTVLAIQCLQWGHAAYGERFSARGLALRITAAEGRIDAATPFYSVATYDQSLPFYLQRTLTLVDYRDEMDMGLSLEPARNGPAQAELLRQWPRLGRAYALMDFGTLQQWQSAGIALREVARSNRRVVVATVTAQ